MKEKWKTLFLSDWTPAEKGLLLADVLLFGILLGWLTSPFKNGLQFFSGNGNTWNYGSDDEEIEEFEESEE